MSEIDAIVRTIAEAARRAARRAAAWTTADKDRALVAIADALGQLENASAVLAANKVDLDDAKARGTKGALLDRLMLDDERLAAVAKSVREIASLPDPVGEVVSRVTRPNGLHVARMRVPLGVIAMIYEARPNVTVEASALTLKVGDAIILRGGSEARASNAALARVIAEAIAGTGLDPAIVQVLNLTDRDAVRALVQQTEFVDLAIPRGGESLIRFVTEHARVPVVQHYKGVCHLFVDTGFEPEAAAKIVANAKLSRPGVCNALECLLVDAASADTNLPPIARALLAGGCELRGCKRTQAIVPEAKPAAADDFGKEFLDKILAIRVVDGLEGALEHVAAYGSGHTEAILTHHEEHAARWRREVDAACVVVNASTRFHDGGELGLGAEIGIATSRLHWRGPMGLEALTTMKWVIEGDGQIRI